MTNKRLPRYILVGACAYIAEMSSLYGFIKIGNLQAVAAVGLSFWIGLIVAFTLQKIVTFKNYDRKPRSLAKQLTKYSLLVVWNYTVTLLIVYLLTPYISAFIVRTGAIMLIAAWNYFIYRHIFKRRQHNDELLLP